MKILLKMDLISNICVWFTVFFIIDTAEALECYRCNSQGDPKCGVTFGFTAEEALKYTETCVGNVTACQKLDTMDSFKNVMLVSRSCWSTTGYVEDGFLACTKFSKGKACYCRSEDGKPCNSGAQLTSVLSVLAGSFIAVLAFNVHKIAS